MGGTALAVAPAVTPMAVIAVEAILMDMGMYDVELMMDDGPALTAGHKRYASRRVPCGRERSLCIYHLSPDFTENPCVMCNLN